MQDPVSEAFSKYLDSLNHLPNFRKYISPEREDWIAISSLPFFCDRKLRILDLHPEKKEQVQAQQRINMDIGTAIHAMCQSGLGKAGILLGSWKCPLCGNIEKGKYPERQCKCSSKCEGQLKLNKATKSKPKHYTGCIWPCGFEALDRNCVSCPRMVNWEYVETRVGCDKLKLTGKYDGLLDINNELFILEIKTISSDAYSWLTKPKTSHIIQTRVYQHLEGKNLKRDLRSIIWYVDRGNTKGAMDSSIGKGFIVDPNEEEVLALFKRVEQYWKDKSKPGIPCKSLCKTAKDGQKVFCPVASMCFDPEFVSRVGEF